MSGLELANVGVVGHVEATVGVNQVYGSVTDWASSPDQATLYTKLLKFTEGRAIMRPSGDVEKVDIEAQRKHMVESPLLNCLRNMLCHEAPASYVLYAPPSNGKTVGARAFMNFTLKRLYPNAEMAPKALMLSGAVNKATYFDHMSAAFKSGSSSWFSSLVASLSRTTEEIDAKKPPSVLILDDFDKCGSDNLKHHEHEGFLP